MPRNWQPLPQSLKRGKTSLRIARYYLSITPSSLLKSHEGTLLVIMPTHHRGSMRYEYPPTPAYAIIIIISSEKPNQAKHTSLLTRNRTAPATKGHKDSARGRERGGPARTPEATAARRRPVFFMVKLAPMKPLESSARTIPLTLSVDSSGPEAPSPPPPPLPPSLFAAGRSSRRRNCEPSGRIPAGIGTGGPTRRLIGASDSGFRPLYHLTRRECGCRNAWRGILVVLGRERTSS